LAPGHRRPRATSSSPSPPVRLQNVTPNSRLSLALPLFPLLGLWSERCDSRPKRICFCVPQAINIPTETPGPVHCNCNKQNNSLRHVCLPEKPRKQDPGCLFPLVPFTIVISHTLSYTCLRQDTSGLVAAILFFHGVEPFFFLLGAQFFWISLTGGASPSPDPCPGILTFLGSTMDPAAHGNPHLRQALNPRPIITCRFHQKRSWCLRWCF
jgi:hypothetical protein